MNEPFPAPPRRQWLLGVVGIAVAGGIGWSTWNRRRRQAGVPSQPGVPQLLDFGMDFCEQCKKTRAILSRLEPEFAGKVQIRYLDVRDEANEALAAKYRTRVIPLLVLLDRDGVEVWRHEGAASESLLRQRLSQVLSGPQRHEPVAGPSVSTTP